MPAQAIEAAGFQFHPHLTARHQITGPVTDIILTHGDPDHAGGLADFPEATVHISQEEFAAIQAGHPRYSPAQFQHGPRWQIHPPGSQRWFGLEARPIPGLPIHLIPLFGHTLGHCGVAVDNDLLHVGDAYYLRIELSDDQHPIHQLTAQNAVDDRQRRHSLAQLRALAGQVQMFGYHDFSEIEPANGNKLFTNPTLK